MFTNNNKIQRDHINIVSSPNYDYTSFDNSWVYIDKFEKRYWMSETYSTEYTCANIYMEYM